AEATLVAESLLGALRHEMRVGERVEHPRRVTASIGVAPFTADAASGEELLVHADIAMYDAKEAGRDRVQVYDAAEDRQERMQARLKWSDRIRDALEQD